MTALLIFLVFLAVFSMSYSSKQKTKLDWKRKQIKTNIKMQDELEKKFFVQIMNDLKRMDSVNRLYGDKLITALQILFSEYKQAFPDVESHYVYQSSSQRLRRVYTTAAARLSEACNRYNSQLRIRFTNCSPFSLLPPIPSSSDLEPYPLWRHIWLEYSPLFTEEPPIIKHPELLYCEPYKMKVFEKDNGVKYYDKDGNEIIKPTKNEKLSLYRYAYHPTSRRLYVGIIDSVPIFLINDLVVKLTTEGLKRHGFQYSPDRMNSELIDAQEKLKTEKEKYPWLDEEDKKYK